jgi:UDP-N-acetylglucosamine 3-dehydrogenase
MRIGIVGCGGIAPVHLGVYKRLEGVEIASLCDLNLERAKNLARKFGVEKTYSDYWQMFEKERLDVVDICTPVSTHVRIVSDAAKAVPAILVEKPMALNVSECDEIIHSIEKHDSKLCIGHNQIFSPHIQKAKTIVDSESFRLFSFKTMLKASFDFLRAYDLAAPWNVKPEQKGIVWEVCCHHAYLQLFFLPEIEEVYAVGGKVKYPVHDDFSVLLRTKNQNFGMIELSWVQREFEVIYEFKGATGKRLQILWDFDYMLELSQDPPFSVGLIAKNMFVDQKRLLQKWFKFGTCYLHKRKLLPTANLIATYIEAIKKDLPSPVTPTDGRNTINLLECIEKSLNEKRPIKVKN